MQPDVYGKDRLTGQEGFVVECEVRGGFRALVGGLFYDGFRDEGDNAGTSGIPLGCAPGALVVRGAPPGERGCARWWAATHG